ncbi:LytR/AlgR family response regulator transcription factor [Flavilitoribacter nigricans]|uniref:DNA-binding response regulator n=1 Tax=Flavilitoribacter nigricans (strain ATCC 23147 / DSM 23189 / NBRC 102662 / NCIMB 1420 / SS-2) TaxID=1122177 RepID=A0A2D0N9S2_FLAN2|nr:response regulator [Flavilitoribacter nigricans]PHN05138.1 DNA-binding response regulator [Flavilitoribacter nigricans DSM 23189 = NBRC 102662]
MTEKMNILIVEDEFLTADTIRNYLLELGYGVTGMARDAEEALSILEATETDMAILDLNIQGSRDGIWLAGMIKETYNIPFIFLTAYSDERTVKSAVETRPFGYLVKPFTKMDIYTTLEVARQNYTQIVQQGELKLGTGVQDKPLPMDEYLFVKEKNVYSKIRVRDIAYVKSELKYIELYVEKKRHVIRYSLAEFIDLMPAEHFIQVHRSYVVNKNYVDHIGINYILVAGTEIPMSSKRKEEVLNRFNFL